MQLCCCSQEAISSHPLLLVLGLFRSLKTHNSNLLSSAISCLVSPLWFTSTQMFACAPFMHWLVCLKHKYGWGIWRSLPTHFPLTGLAHIDLDCQCVEISRALILANPCTVFYLLWPYMVSRDDTNTFTATLSQAWIIFVEGSICALHREKQGLFASNHSQMFTVSWSFPPTCLWPYLFFLCVLIYFSASLWTCSAPSGGSVASDAACGG